ncbi:MAG TPA: DUF192 domain-containing protein [Solirubrobacteraceae bacterium]|nr:DUF192 domain-containing protein [Solirubrobacteraceae bacterium]
MRSREPVLIVNLSSERVVCERGLVADRALSRMWGLLGRRQLPAGEGLLLEPAPAIHTAFMRFPIDVLFLDAYMRVIKIVEAVPPWRSLAARHARAVLELAAGEVSQRGVKLGDRLDIQEVREPKLARTLNGAHRTSERSSEPHILVISRDRRFRAVAAALFSRRGWPVAVGHPADDLESLMVRACPDVALVDASPSLTAAAEMVARLKQARRSVQTVIVSDGAQSDLPTLITHPKWGSFDSLCTAVAEAHANSRTAVAAGGGWEVADE